MLDLGVEQHDAAALRIERFELVLERPAVEANHMARLAEQRRELVHDTAADADVVMLGHLSDLGQLFPVEPETVCLVERESDGALERGRGREAGAERHVAAERHVERQNPAPRASPSPGTRRTRNKPTAAKVFLPCRSSSTVSS